MKRILFLGDSITDCGHCFTPDNLGNGYVKLISERLHAARSLLAPPHGAACGRHGQTQPDCLVVNGGCDGFTFPSIYRKWRQSYSGCSFDTVSVLGGINDVGSVMDAGLSESQIQVRMLDSGLALKKLLEELLARRTAQILLPEPFLFPCPDFLNTWTGRLEQMRTIIRSAASVSDTVRCIPLQPALNAEASKSGFSRITTDGIHLTAEGHRIVCSQILPHLLTG